MWSYNEWQTWAEATRRDWTQAMQDAWTDTVAAYRNAVEVDPTAAFEAAKEFWSLLFTADDGGAWYNVGVLWALERDLDPETAAAGRAAAASVLDMHPDALTGDAFASSFQGLSLPFLKDCSWSGETKRPGILPLLIGGLVVGIAALCWSSVRLTEARVENRRVLVTAQALREAAAASRENRKLDLAPVMRGLDRPVGDLPSHDTEGGAGFGTMLVVAGAVGLGIFLWGRRS